MRRCSHRAPWVSVGPAFYFPAAMGGPVGRRLGTYPYMPTTAPVPRPTGLASDLRPRSFMRRGGDVVVIGFGILGAAVFVFPPGSPGFGGGCQEGKGKEWTWAGYTWRAAGGEEERGSKATD